jgi:hypothetical protein
LRLRDCVRHIEAEQKMDKASKRASEGMIGEGTKVELYWYICKKKNSGDTEEKSRIGASLVWAH